MINCGAANLCTFENRIIVIVVISRNNCKTLSEQFVIDMDLSSVSLRKHRSSGANGGSTANLEGAFHSFKSDPHLVAGHQPDPISVDRVLTLDHKAEGSH